MGFEDYNINGLYGMVFIGWILIDIIDLVIVFKGLNVLVVGMVLVGGVGGVVMV